MFVFHLVAVRMGLGWGRLPRAGGCKDELWGCSTAAASPSLPLSPPAATPVLT